MDGAFPSVCVRLQIGGSDARAGTPLPTIIGIWLQCLFCFSTRTGQAALSSTLSLRVEMVMRCRMVRYGCFRSWSDIYLISGCLAVSLIRCAPPLVVDGQGHLWFPEDHKDPFHLSHPFQPLHLLHPPRRSYGLGSVFLRGCIS